MATGHELAVIRDREEHKYTVYAPSIGEEAKRFRVSGLELDHFGHEVTAGTPLLRLQPLV